MLANGFGWAAGLVLLALLLGGFLGWPLGFFRGWRAQRAFLEHELRSGEARIGRMTYLVQAIEIAPARTSAAWHAAETEPLVHEALDLPKST